MVWRVTPNTIHLDISDMRHLHAALRASKHAEHDTLHIHEMLLELHSFLADAATNDLEVLCITAIPAKAEFCPEG